MISRQLELPGVVWEVVAFGGGEPETGDGWDTGAGHGKRREHGMFSGVLLKAMEGVEIQAVVQHRSRRCGGLAASRSSRAAVSQASKQTDAVVGHNSPFG